MTNSCKHWTLAASMMVGGCQLGVEQLEVGDDLDESGGVDETGADTDANANADECVTQGSNLDGGSNPIDYPLPQCEVECASGWGHGAATLPSAWTLDLEHEGENTGFAQLGLLPGGDVLAVIGQPSAAARFVTVSPTGEIVGDVEQPAITGDLWDLGVDADGTIYGIWRNGDVQALTASSSSGEHLWTVELGPFESFYSVLAPLESGVVVGRNPANEFETSELLRVAADGTVASMGPIPTVFEIAVSPSGDSIVMANITTITWTDFDLFPSVKQSQGIADVWAVLGLVALDDERAVSVGAAQNWDEDGSLHGYVKQTGPMGLDWEGRYDRALAWCSDEVDTVATEEVFYDVARLSDGSLLVVGSESAGFDGPAAGQTGSAQVHQPRIAHISAEGQVLASDRGFWRGQAAAAVDGEDGTAYVLLFEFDEQGQQRLHLRKYLP